MREQRHELTTQKKKKTVNTHKSDHTSDKPSKSTNDKTRIATKTDTCTGSDVHDDEVEMPLMRQEGKLTTDETR